MALGGLVQRSVPPRCSQRGAPWPPSPSSQAEMSVARVPLITMSEGAVCHTHPVRVAFGDTDAAGIVYYANYLRYFEAARSEMLRAHGARYADLFAAGVLMPVVETWLRYRASARYDDLIDVTVWLHEVRRASVVVGCRITCDGTVLVVGGARLGCMGTDGRVRPLPDAIRALG